MTASAVRIPLPTLRGEIENVLVETGDARVAATAKYLAGLLGAPVRAVKDELQKMVLEGALRTRTLRSGEVLFKKQDKHDSRWGALRSHLHLPTGR